MQVRGRPSEGDSDVRRAQRDRGGASDIGDRETAMRRGNGEM